MAGLFLDPNAIHRVSADQRTQKGRIEQAAVQFEAILLKEVVKDAIPTLESDGMAADTYSDMLATELAGHIAKAADFGLAEILQKQITGESAAPPAVRPRPHPHPVQRPAPDFPVTSGFGMREHPVTGRRHHHQGVDIGTPVGTPVLSPTSGTVARITETDNGGLSVHLAHQDGSESTYRHLHRILVTEGENVQEGQAFAETGASGRVTGPHLHVELKRAGKRIDPSALLERIFAKDRPR